MAYRRTDVVAHFGFVTIEGKRCSSTGCGGEPVAAMPWRTPEEGSNVVWACQAHAEKMMAANADMPLQQISPTCGYGVDTPCGAAATHIEIVGLADRKTLGLVSVCARHAEEGGAWPAP